MFDLEEEDSNPLDGLEMLSSDQDLHTEEPVEPPEYEE